MNFKQNSNKIIPVFFAVDDNYAPYLGVAIKSLLKNASCAYLYRIHILTTSLSDENRAKILALATDNSQISFENVSEKLKNLSGRLHLRDYYSEATYYRIFIASLFPEYSKAFYFDADLVFVGDVSEMYETDIGNCLIGAVQENVMLEPVFKAYCEKVLGVPNYKYINAGMLLINLDEFRTMNIESKFVDLLLKRRYIVAQDQDYLNVLCKDRVYYFGYEWNCAPVKGLCDSVPKIVHYKLKLRPWHYDNILYGEYFWEYAANSGYLAELQKIKASHTLKNKFQDTMMLTRLAHTAAKETVNAQLEEQAEGFYAQPNINAR